MPVLHWSGAVNVARTLTRSSRLVFQVSVENCRGLHCAKLSRNFSSSTQLPCVFPVRQAHKFRHKPLPESTAASDTIEEQLTEQELSLGLPLSTQCEAPCPIENTPQPDPASRWHPLGLPMPQHSPLLTRIRALGGQYSSLAKARLTGLVVVTSLAGYAMGPVGGFDPVVAGLLTAGTALTSSSANAINQILEVPYDCQMNRTKNRPLVRGKLTSLHAAGFALASAGSGLAILYWGTNPIVAALGAFNLVLYTAAYTPMKRVTPWNTWIGSLVGAVPPMMGWAACTGGLEPGAWLLAGILYVWQFPHFMALSWNLRPDYSRAGYQMTASVNPGRCRRVALRYSLAMMPLVCVAPPLLHLTSWTLPLLALPLNAQLCRLGWRFYSRGDSQSSRRLFLYSLVYLPVLLILMICCAERSKGDV